MANAPLLTMDAIDESGSKRDKDRAMVTKAISIVEEMKLKTRSNLYLFTKTNRTIV